MGKLVNALFEWRDSESALRNPPGWLLDWFGGGASKSGISVNADTAMRASAVFACVRVIAETVGCTPLILYERLPDGSRQRAESSTVYKILHEAPNEWQTPAEFKEQLTGHAVLRGNAFALIIEDNRGGIQEVIPLHPDRMTVDVARDKPAPVRYRYIDHNGEERIYQPREIFHLRGLSTDGILGLYLATLAKENIALSLAAEEHASRTFSNGAWIRGVLKVPGSLKDQAFERLKKQFNDSYQGLSNANKTAILEGGTEWQSIGMTSRDAEFLELRKFQIADIARIFRMPPHLIGDLDKATFSNIEQQSLEFITYTMMPWFAKWEQACNRDLFLPAYRSRFFVEALTENFVRGDIKSRYESYAVARQNGWLSVNDILRKENMNEIGPEGDTRMAPLNMVPLEKFGEEPPAPPPAPAQKMPMAPSQPKRDMEAIRILLLDAARRIVAKEAFTIRKKAKRGLSEIKDFYYFEAQPIDEILRPVFSALNKNGEDFDSLWLRHVYRQLNDINDWFKETPRIIEKHLDDWANLLPEELTAEWLKYFEHE